MVPLVLIMLLMHLVEQIACQGSIAFPIDKREGETCELSNGRTGQCRKSTECSNIGTGGIVPCQVVGRQFVVCCDIMQEACTAVSENKFGEHIVGNSTKAVVGEFPFMALVMFNDSNTICGASIISDRFLLTAAHCFRQGKPIAVRLGTIHANDDLADTIPIAKIHRHAQFSYLKRRNDIALIELQTKMTINSQVAPICLYTKEDELPKTQNLTLIGWGKDDSDVPSLELLKGKINPVIRSECQARYDAGNIGLNITDGHMCALGVVNKNGTATDACQGDSGGPLVMKRDDRYYLVGVVSTGSGCGARDLAGLYTWVPKYVKWINEKKGW